MLEREARLLSGFAAAQSDATRRRLLAAYRYGSGMLHANALAVTRFEAHQPSSQSKAVLPTVLLGIGLGGFFDGIVLHQILQWHHMLSAHTPPDTLANLQLNTLADGLFHAATWVCTSIGVLLLWAAVRGGASLGWSRLIGGLLAGWGGFNVAEGLIDHQILGVHHVRPGPDELLYDMGFLIWGAGMLIVGVWLLRGSEDRAEAD